MKNKPASTLLISSIAITAFLCFIDEGYYNFNWVKSAGNWIAFAVYTLIIFLAQWPVYSLLSRFLNANNSSRTILSIAIGTTIGILFAVLVVF